MPEITNQQMVGKTVEHIETLPAAIEVTYSDAGIIVTQSFSVEGSLSDIHRRVGALIDQLKRHATVPAVLAHQQGVNALPVGLLEY